MQGVWYEGTALYVPDQLSAGTRTVIEGPAAALLTLSITKSLHQINDDPSRNADNPIGWTLQFGSSDLQGGARRVDTPPQVAPATPLTITLAFRQSTGTNVVRETPISSISGLVAQIAAMLGLAVTVFGATLRIVDYVVVKCDIRCCQSEKPASSASPSSSPTTTTPSVCVPLFLSLLTPLRPHYDLRWPVCLFALLCSVFILL